MSALAGMYNGYDATTWLTKPKRHLDGKIPGDLLKEGKYEEVGRALKKEAKYKRYRAKIKR